MADFTFTTIADSSDSFFSDFGSPSINDQGTVAFVSELTSEQEGIFTGDGETTTIIADSSSSFDDLGLPSINNEGIVAFQATLDEEGDGIFTSDGTTTTTIADSSSRLSAFGTAPVINDEGTVAFNAFRDTGGEGIFTSSGESSGEPSDAVVNSDGRFQLFGAPAINSEGTLAYRAFLDNGETGIFTSNGTTTTIVDTSGSFGELFGTPDINDEGLIAFAGRQGENDGIFTSDGTTITAIADTSGPFSFFGGGTFINNQGTVAFTADLDATPGVELGIYTGPDPVADKVIAVGDSLLGSTVTDLSSGGLNNDGQIAFFAELEDETSGIFRADIGADTAPEPSNPQPGGVISGSPDSDQLFITQSSLVFGGAGDDILDASVGTGGSRLDGGPSNDLLFAGVNDTLLGRDGDDRLFAGEGGSTLVGGEGMDQFWIASGGLPSSENAPNTILDFQAETDAIGIAGLPGVTGFGDLSISQSGSDTVISALEQDLAILTGVQSNTLDSSSFAFA